VTKVQVTILGQTFALRSDASAEEVQRVADFVNEQINLVATQGRSADSLNIALLALFNVAGSYLRQSEPATGGQHELTERLGRLLQRVEDAVSGSLPSPNGH